MEISRKRISKEGKILLTSKSQVERNNALENINIWRTNHLHPLNVMKNYLVRMLKKMGLQPVLVSQRLKRLISIEYKLDLNENMGLGGMQDIGGFRAVLKDKKDLMKLKSALIYNKYHKPKIVDYIKYPKPSGYRSIHFIYTYNSKIEKFDGLKVELQIRTKLQHNWATAVETAGIITKTSLKSSQGPDDWLNFFKIVSSLFAFKEEQPILLEHADKTLQELMLECEELAIKLKVIDILKALRVSAKQIEIEQFSGDYYLININAKDKFVNIKRYKKKEFEKASKDYLEIEKGINVNENAVVLVSSTSIKSLKKAYPSYFLDTSEFISALEKIIDNCQKLKN